MAIFTELLKAIAPIMWAGLAIYAFYTLKSTIISLLKSRAISIKVAGTEINLPEATEKIGQAVADIQSKLAELPIPSTNISLPRSEEINSQNESATSSMTQQLGVPIRPPTARILWVDDQPLNYAFLIERLRGEGHLIDTSTTTEDAIHRLNSYQYDGIISGLWEGGSNVKSSISTIDFVITVRESNIILPILIFANSRGIELWHKLYNSGVNIVTNSGIDLMRFVNTCAVARQN
ncbi:hypothetical protein [Xanthobacter sp. 126]|uniref:hypothetical protein n=1 Tax=Xanthobacter sp. 126 TaxID=1131814 RepID=UPI0012DCA702|nr:hypothetical protein [Xanthobacter sp. 126]